MEPDFRSPISPGTPLFPLSSENANARIRPDSPQKDDMAPQLSPSPSLSSLPHLLHGMNGHQRTASDVQAKVTQFNGLAKEAAQRRKDNEAVLKRAILGREEAESESHRLKDVNELLRREIEEGRGREKRVTEKAQVLQEEVNHANEVRGREKSVYEKEVRRARKEAFKSSSELVNCQEELKCARNRYTLMREDAESHKRAKLEKEKEILGIQHTLIQIEEDMEAQKKMKAEKGQEELLLRIAGLEEELENLRKDLSISEEEKKTLKSTLDKEEVARMASAGSIALPQLPESDEFASPRKRRREDRESLKENLDPMAVDQEDQQDEELMALKEDLRMEKKLRARAEEATHFLKMECQFGVCSCRIAEQKGKPYIHDHKFAPQIQQARETRQAHIQASAPINESSATIPIDPAIFSSPPAADPARALCFSPNSGTFTTQASEPAASYVPTLSLRGGSSSSTISINNRPSTPNHSDIAAGYKSPPPPPATTHGNRPQHARSASSRALDASLATRTPGPRPLAPPRTISHPSRGANGSVTGGGGSHSQSSFHHSQSNFQERSSFQHEKAHFQREAHAWQTSSVTTIPLKEDDPVFSPAPNTPGGMSREEALERIRARRGRARSFAVGIGGTPGRATGAGGMGSIGVVGQARGEGERQGQGEGRVISAPQFGGGGRVVR